MPRGKIRSTVMLAGVFAVVGALLAGCSGADVVGEYPQTRRKGDTAPVYGERESVFGEGGLNIFGGDKKSGGGGGGGGTGIGVNGYLWRATLDTIAFMPINSADPFGGVIITDWHSPVNAPPSERFKMNIYILGRSLRADGVRVGVFRQVQDSGGAWRDMPVPADAATGIEDAILTKARQLRNETLQQ